MGVIAFATACQILVLSVFNGFEDLVKSLYSSFYADIKIIPTRGKTFILDSGSIARLKLQPGVQAVSLIAEEKALLQNHDLQSIVYLKGVDDNYKQVSGVPAKTVEGAYETGTSEEPGVVVGSGIQNAAGVNVDGILAPSVLTLVLPK